MVRQHTSLFVTLVSPEHDGAGNAFEQRRDAERYSVLRRLVEQVERRSRVEMRDRSVQLRESLHARDVVNDRLGGRQFVCGERVGYVKDVRREKVDGACVLVLVKLVSVVEELLTQVASYHVGPWVPVCDELADIRAHCGYGYNFF